MPVEAQVGAEVEVEVEVEVRVEVEAAGKYMARNSERGREFAVSIRGKCGMVVVSRSTVIIIFVCRNCKPPIFLNSITYDRQGPYCSR